MRFLLYVAFFNCVQILHAQDSTNLAWSLGGNVSFSQSQKSGHNLETSSRVFYFAPYIGKQFAQKWMAGIGPSFQFSTHDYKQVDDDLSSLYESQSYGVRAFVRYHFNPGKKFQYHLQSALGLDFATMYWSDSRDEDSTSQSIVISPMFIYSATKKLNLLTGFRLISYRFGTSRGSNELGEHQISKFSNAYLGLSFSDIQVGCEMRF